MDKVFEKIIERLGDLQEGLLTTNTDYNSYLIDAMVRARKTVRGVAEEYNNGWIPCSSGRLPEENTDVEVTIEEIANDVGGKRYYNVRSWLQDGQWVIKKNPYKPTVIAWKYPTEPYQPKGEQ